MKINIHSVICVSWICWQKSILKTITENSGRFKKTEHETGNRMETQKEIS